MEKIAGMLEHAELSLFSGSWARTIEFAGLTSVSIVAWSEGPPNATANLNDGASFAIPSLYLPEKAVFVDALKRFGIALAVIGAGETHDRYCVSYVGNAPISGRGQRKAASI